MKIHVNMERDFARAGLAVFITGEDASGERHLAQHIDLVWEKVDTGAIWPEPTLFFNEWHNAEEFLTGLAAELIRMGYGKDAIKETTGELTATKYHLEDMRKLVGVTKEKG